jgi:hypothetical protein
MTDPRTTPARPTFVVHLRPKPGIDPVRALRAALKTLGRRFGFTVTSVAVASRTKQRQRDDDQHGGRKGRPA